MFLDYLLCYRSPTLNCGWDGGGGGGDAGYLAKEETPCFEDYNGLLLSCSIVPTTFVLDGSNSLT